MLREVPMYRAQSPHHASGLNDASPANERTSECARNSPISEGDLQRQEAKRSAQFIASAWDFIFTEVSVDSTLDKIVRIPASIDRSPARTGYERAFGRGCSKSGSARCDNRDTIHDAYPQEPCEERAVGPRRTCGLAARLQMNKVMDVRPLENYRVWLRFADGTQGEIDLSDLAGHGVFAAWSDPELFRAVHPEEGGGIEWPGGLDICPDSLFMRLTGKAVEDIFPSLKPSPVDA
jgi:hypothetical protein